VITYAESLGTLEKDCEENWRFPSPSYLDPVLLFRGRPVCVAPPMAHRPARNEAGNAARVAAEERGERPAHDSRN
jgi:hypothetical protein